MKKLNLLFIAALSMSSMMGQDIADAVRYSQDEVQGTARFRSMGGAFGALGGDMSAVSINPAGSSIFMNSHASISISNLDTNNTINYFNGANSSSDSKFDLNQTGAAFVFNNTNINSPWRKFTLGVAYDKISNFENAWNVRGVNTNAQSIGDYFLGYAQGLRLDQISAFEDESLSSAYADINSTYGFGNQQGFLGFESYIVEPNSNDDANTLYYSNIVGNNFDQEYTYASTGYNGKFSFNASTQYGDNFYFGLNLNSHFINYEKFTDLYETNTNAGSLVKEVRFQNGLSTNGSGFSFQVGAIAKINEALRVGLSYNSPTWYTISDETTQYLGTVRNENGSNLTQIIDPLVVNVFPDYKLQTPGKITGSLAYIFSDKGLISFDYSRKDYGNTKFKPTSDTYFSTQNGIMNDVLKNASTYRIGGEYRIKQISLRGGYRLEESPYEKDSFYGDLNGYSLGFGYNFGNLNLDLAYEHSQREYNQQLYTVGLTDAAQIDTKVNNVTLTLGFTL
ncbi:OmpP1/FadL family transporter [Gelidibacter salicanalis]|uniref:Outer membrane protein transport protein n=1 Tax=Gelidibacter salicanalis TaxID=291193 RepID=A0A934KKA6_9FLAO|nr:outer membrane protein transport protein [Gelidibacter salicanalis]MBJ7881016.1 outer membrane protein transport protein [Gelidibacter salicanalis]